MLDPLFVVYVACCIARATTLSVRESIHLLPPRHDHDQPVNSQQVCRNQPADIGFLLDESGSVGGLDFQNNLEAILKFIEVFDIGPDALQISVFAFHSLMGDGFYFNRCRDQACVVSNVKNIRYNGGGEDFEMALDFAEHGMFQKTKGMRDFSLKILIFFTDGSSQIIDGGYPLHQLGVIVYAVGVGSGANKDQLRQIATNDSYVFMIDSYNSLIGQVSQNIRNKACNDILSNPCERNPQPCKNQATCIIKGGAKYICLCTVGFTGHNCETYIDYCIGVTCANGGTCVDGLTDYTCQCAEHFGGRTCGLNLCKPYPADVVFVIDSSNSFSSHYLDISKTYVKNITRTWEITPESFQIAIVSFANAAYIDLPFNDTLSNTTLQDIISNIKFRGGRSELHLGLNTAKTLLLNRNRLVSNEPVKKFIILISDGLPSTPYAVSPVNSVGIDTFAVAVGKDVSHNYLDTVTKGMDKVFPFHTDKLWHEMMNKLVDVKCGYCNLSQEADLIFALDTSSSMPNDVLFGKIPSLLRRILSKVKIGVKDKHIALVTYHNMTEIRFNFTDYPEAGRVDMEKQLSYFVKSSESETNITLMAEVVKKMILRHTFGARDTSKKVLVVLSKFINGLDTEAHKTIQSLKDNGIEVFVIGFDFENDHFTTMSEIATTSFHIGIDDDGVVDIISTFLSGLLNQLHTLECKLP